MLNCDNFLKKDVSHQQFVVKFMKNIFKFPSDVYRQRNFLYFRDVDIYDLRKFLRNKHFETKKMLNCDKKMLSFCKKRF